jgi:Laminin N-terminal (Domain VI)
VKANEQEALCSDAYSGSDNTQQQYSGARIAFSTLEGRPSAHDFDNSPVLQDWQTATDIRVVFDRLAPLKDTVATSGDVIGEATAADGSQNDEDASRYKRCLYVQSIIADAQIETPCNCDYLFNYSSRLVKLLNISLEVNVNTDFVNYRLERCFTINEMHALI